MQPLALWQEVKWAIHVGTGMRSHGQRRASAPCPNEVVQKHQSSRVSSALLPLSGTTGRLKGNHILDATNVAKQNAWSLFGSRTTRDEGA